MTYKTLSENNGCSPLNISGHTILDKPLNIKSRNTHARYATIAQQAQRSNRLLACVFSIVLCWSNNCFVVSTVSWSGFSGRVATSLSAMNLNWLSLLLGGFGFRGPAKYSHVNTTREYTPCLSQEDFRALEGAAEVTALSKGLVGLLIYLFSNPRFGNMILSNRPRLRGSKQNLYRGRKRSSTTDFR